MRTPATSHPVTERTLLSLPKPKATNRASTHHPETRTPLQQDVSKKFQQRALPPAHMPFFIIKGQTIPLTKPCINTSLVTGNIYHY